MRNLQLASRQLKQIVLFTVALLLIGIALWQAEQPRQPVWGKYYEPHAGNKFLVLSPNKSYKQSFQLAYKTIDNLLLQLEPQNYKEHIGSLQITVSQNQNKVTTSFLINQVSPTGNVLIPMPPLTLNTQQLAEFSVALVDTETPINIKFQRDSKKIVNGQLYVIEDSIIKKRSGHLAFRPQYLATARELTGLSLPIWLTMLSGITFAIAILWYLQKNTRPNKNKRFHLSKKDLIVASIITIYAGLFIWLHLIPATHLPTNADMTKDTLYLKTTAQAINNSVIPYWQHTTCGGQPLFGNPETSVLSLGTPLALLFGSVTSLKILLSLEVASAALGFYVLARLFGLKPLGSTLPAITITLGGFVINRVFLGHTMFIGGIAFMPWFLITSYLAMHARPYWSIIAASFITLSFFRGDTHVIAYAIMAMFVISIILTIKIKKITPLLVFTIIVALGAGFSLIKILPVLEGKEHFRGNTLPQLVAPLIEQEELLNIFLDIPEMRGHIDVINGELEGWENIGIYTGPIPLALALIGLFIAPRRTRFLMIPLLIVFTVLGEGSLYNDYLQHIPYLGQLLRLPSRLLLISVIAGTLLGGAALDRLRLGAGRPIGLIITTLLLLLVIRDINIYGRRTLQRMEFIPPPIPIINTKISTSHTSLAVKANTQDPYLHPLTVARHNSVAPRSCQDFNKQPPFTIASIKPLAIDQSNNTLLSTLSNNSILIHPEQDSTTIQVYTNDSSLLQIKNGYVSPINEQIDPLSIIPQDNPVTLQYRSNTALPGLLLSTGFFLLALSHRPTTKKYNNQTRLKKLDSI